MIMIGNCEYEKYQGRIFEGLIKKGSRFMF